MDLTRCAEAVPEAERAGAAAAQLVSTVARLLRQISTRRPGCLLAAVLKRRAQRAQGRGGRLLRKCMRG